MSEKITYTPETETYNVPDSPTIPVIIGDGVGPELWEATRPILLKAARKIGKNIIFLPILAGTAALEKTGEYLPQETLASLREYRVSLKGPLATPVGGGIRSLNVAIRKELDLYACVRPVKYIPGVPSPVTRPELMDMVIFRENTEDVYAGLEWAAGSPSADALADFVRERLSSKIRPNSALGLKPMSEFCSKRLVKMAIKWSLKEKRTSLTLVHKGNIMKFTEGAFRTWGYELAKDEFGSICVPENEAKENEKRLIIKDRIADNMFMQTLLRPDEYSILAMPNLNGDYLSDALAAQIGGLGMAPGANIGDGLAVFEATHGTAPKYIGQNKANPSSLILSGALMLEFLGWTEAAELIREAIKKTIADKIMTNDLARQIKNQASTSCLDFSEAVLNRI